MMVPPLIVPVLGARTKPVALAVFSTMPVKVPKDWSSERM
jgi:hypothetical protein